MKTFWNIVAALAIVNVLAMAGVLAWLKTSDRLSRDRIVAVRERFIRTVAQEDAEKAATQSDDKAKAVERAQAAKMAEPPVTAAEQIAEQQAKDDQRLQVLLRQQQEINNLRTGLMLQIGQLEERERKLEADRKAFAAERKKIAETEGDKQFLLALATLEGQKPRDAKQVLRAMLEQKQTDQVVAYLAKMEEGKRSKVLAEFVKDGPALAAELLERLRTRGIVVPQPGSLTQAGAHESTGSAATVGAFPSGAPRASR